MFWRFTRLFCVAIRSAHLVLLVEMPLSSSVLQAAPVKAASSGEFQWDMTPHWKTRQVSLMKYKDDPETLKVIYAIENSGGVKKMIESMLGKLG